MRFEKKIRPQGDDESVCVYHKLMDGEYQWRANLCSVCCTVEAVKNDEGTLIGYALVPFNTEFYLKRELAECKKELVKLFAANGFPSKDKLKLFMRNISVPKGIEGLKHGMKIYIKKGSAYVQIAQTGNAIKCKLMVSKYGFDYEELTPEECLAEEQ